MLSLHGITALCDVRSSPYSQVNPHFNREELKASLLACRVKYVFLGRELGARSEDPNCYEDGRVRYDRLAETALFRQGINRLQDGVKNYRIALMCAEKEPLECHRTILVARYIYALGLDVQHILADGSLESHDTALTRLIDVLNLKQVHLFRPLSDLTHAAYTLQEQRIAFRLGETRVERSKSVVS